MIASFIYKPNIENMKMISIYHLYLTKKVMVISVCILMNFPIQTNPIKWDRPLYIYGVIGWNFLVMMYLTHKVPPIICSRRQFQILLPFQK